MSITPKIIRNNNSIILGRATIFFGLLLVFSAVFANASEKKTLYYAPVDDPIYRYPIELLDFLFKEADMDYTLQAIDQEIPYGRRIEYVDAGRLDFATFSTRQELENKLLPVRIPLYKGLLGHRIFIIRQGDQNRFANVDSFSDLRTLKAGQGAKWADTKVLQQAGIPTVTAIKYEGLFHMLDGGRFDYFPRAVFEPFSELEKRSDLRLSIEEDLLLVYPLAMYFFVSNSNP